MPLINRNNTYNIITNNTYNVITNNEVPITIDYSDYSEYSNYLRNNNYITNNYIVDANAIVNINEDNVRNTASYDYVRELKTSVSKISFSVNKLDREKFSMEIE